MIDANRKRHEPFAARQPVRPAIPKANRGFICPNCDLVLADGVSYDWCPVCFAGVDWVDLRKPVWACPTCDTMVNETTRAPWCKEASCRCFCWHSMVACAGR